MEITLFPIAEIGLLELYSIIDIYLRTTSVYLITQY